MILCFSLRLLCLLQLQVRARNLAQAAANRNQPSPAAYYRAMRWWFWPAWPAFIVVIRIFWLRSTVFRPLRSIVDEGSVH